MESKVLLVGHGSIGQFHLRKLSNLYKFIAVIEPDNLKHRTEINNGCNIQFYTSLSDIKDLNLYKFAVIANWGPDHFKTVRDLKNKGVKKFLVEKPLCDSLWEVDQFEKLVMNKTISMISHFQWSYSYLPDLIKGLSSQDKLGAPVAVVVNGGAKCLATNGIHLLALANIIFDSSPIEDSMLIENNSINPRQGEFLFLEGNATWKYTKSRYLSINFFNRSHNSISILINFEYGLGEIINNRVRFYVITDHDKLKIDKPSRTKTPTKLLYEGEAFNYPDGADGSDKIYKKIENKIQIGDAMHLIKVTRSFLVSLENQQTKNSLFKYKPLRKFYKYKKWKIS